MPTFLHLRCAGCSRSRLRLRLLRGIPPPPPPGTHTPCSHHSLFLASSPGGEQSIQSCSRHEAFVNQARAQARRLKLGLESSSVGNPLGFGESVYPASMCDANNRHHATCSTSPARYRAACDVPHATCNSQHGDRVGRIGVPSLDVPYPHPAHDARRTPVHHTLPARSMRRAAYTIQQTTCRFSSRSRCRPAIFDAEYACRSCPSRWVEVNLH
jgi:hypothetical protein